MFRSICLLVCFIESVCMCVPVELQSYSNNQVVHKTALQSNILMAAVGLVRECCLEFSSVSEYVNVQTVLL